MLEAFRKPGHRRIWTVCFRRSETLLRLVFYVISRLVTRNFDFSSFSRLFRSCLTVIIVSYFTVYYTVNYYGCLRSASKAKRRYFNLFFVLFYFFRLRGPDNFSTNLSIR